MVSTYTFGFLYNFLNWKSTARLKCHDYCFDYLWIITPGQRLDRVICSRYAIRQSKYDLKLLSSLSWMWSISTTNSFPHSLARLSSEPLLASVPVFVTSATTSWAASSYLLNFVCTLFHNRYENVCLAQKQLGPTKRSPETKTVKKEGVLKKRTLFFPKVKATGAYF